jgi:transcriptional regulator with GAF, ATPase, and Fis domain
MFGHIRGAFTDARFDRAGRFEMANKGTIFLDEIGDLDAGSQVKLLSVLQDRTYEVLRQQPHQNGGCTRGLCYQQKPYGWWQRHLQGRLLYRINLITVTLPALRERPGISRCW